MNDGHNYQILTKPRMYEALSAGRFGNCFRVWRHASELVAAGYDGLVGVRCADAPGSPCYTQISTDDALAIGADLERQGLRPVYYEAAPDTWIVLQGEVSREAGGLYLCYSTLRRSMREALWQARYAWGMAARVILAQALSASSWADLEALLDMYPDHVVEFTAYDAPVGCLRGRNACIWECRAY